MAVTITQLSCELFVKSYDHDPGTTNACLASPDGGTTPWYLDMSLFRRGALMYKPTIVGGTGVTLVRVFASTDVAGATNATLVVSSGAVAGDSLNDTIFLEWTAEQIAHLSDAAGIAPASALRYVTVEITHGTSTDEGCLTLLGVDPRFPRASLSGTVIT